MSAYHTDGPGHDAMRAKAEWLLEAVRDAARELPAMTEAKAHEPAAAQTMLVMMLAMNTADMAGHKASPEHLIKGVAITLDGLGDAIMIEHAGRTVPRGTDRWER